MRLIPLSCLALLLLGSLPCPASAQPDAERVRQLESELADLDSDVRRMRSEIQSLEARPPTRTVVNRHDDGVGWTALALFGAFCALWAQNTGRNPWLWFFLGMIFNVIAVVVLLWKNADDLKSQPRAEKPPSMRDDLF